MLLGRYLLFGYSDPQGKPQCQELHRSEPQAVLQDARLSCETE